MCECTYHCAQNVVHNPAQNSSNNLPSYPPDNRHCSDIIYWRGGGPVSSYFWDSESSSVLHWSPNHLHSDCWKNVHILHCNITRTPQMTLPIVPQSARRGNTLSGLSPNCIGVIAPLLTARNVNVSRSKQAPSIQLVFISTCLLKVWLDWSSKKHHWNSSHRSKTSSYWSMNHVAEGHSILASSKHLTDFRRLCA